MSTRKAASPGSTGSSIASGLATDAHRLPLALTVGGLLFALYAWTLSPSVAVGDSGELITAAATLGIPHPPGYPLWCLIHHLPARFAPGSAAAAVNVMTAGFAALAGVLAFGLAAGVLRLPRLTAAGVALLAGVSPSVWGQAVIAEIYALNLVIVLAFASLTLARRFGPLWAFAAGLALVSHGTNALLVLPALVWGVRHAPRRTRGPSAVALLLGLTPILYLPLRSAAGPALDWGHPAEWSGFVDHVTRRQYGRASFAGMGETLSMVGRWIGDVSRSGSPLVWVPVIAGLLRAPRPLGIAWLLTGPVLAAALPSILRGEQRVEPEVFWLPSLVATWLLAGVGVCRIGDRWRRAAGVALLLVAVLFAVLRAPEQSKRGNHIALDYARALFTPLPPRAVLYVVSDYEAFGVMYLQQVDGVRPDVDVRVLHATLSRNVYGRPVPALSAAWADPDRPTFVTLPKPPLDPRGVVPVGLAFQRRGSNAVPKWVSVALRYPDERTLTYFERAVVAGVSLHEAAFRFAQGDALTARLRVSAAERMASDHPRILADLGTLLAQHGEPDEAERLWRRAVTLDPDFRAAWDQLIQLAEIRGDAEAARRLRAERP